MSDKGKIVSKVISEIIRYIDTDKLSYSIGIKSYKGEKN